MDQFNLDFTSRDDSQEEGGVSLAQSLSQDPLMVFPNTSGNYGYGAMLSQDANIPLNAYGHPGPQGDLEGRLSNVMLAYDSTNPAMQMGLDPNAFNYVPTTYPATSMGLAPIDQPQLHPSYSPFQPLPPHSQYLPPPPPQQPQQLPHQQPQPQAQQQQPPSVPPPPNETYNGVGTHSSGSFGGSNFSRTSDQSQVRPRTVQERQRQPPYVQSTLRPLQPLAMQPKKLVPKDQSPGLSTPDAGHTEHTGIYSSSGFDVLGVLVSIDV